MKKPSNGPSSQNQGSGEKQGQGQHPRPRQGDRSQTKAKDVKGRIKDPLRGPQR